MALETMKRGLRLLFMVGAAPVHALRPLPVATTRGLDPPPAAAPHGLCGAQLKGLGKLVGSYDLVASKEREQA